MADDTWLVLCDPSQLRERAAEPGHQRARCHARWCGRLVIGMRHVQLSEPDVAGQGRATAGDYVETTVTDTGVGMTPEVLASALEPFFTTKPAGLGTGLGLSQLDGFVRDTGGVVQLDSAPGQGTTVRFCLPRHEARLVGNQPDGVRLARPIPSGRANAAFSLASWAAAKTVISDRVNLSPLVTILPTFAWRS